MKTEFKDIAHLYLGCECITPNGTAVISTVSMLGGEFQRIKTLRQFMSVEDLNESWKFTDIKPILRTFSSMTEDENICVAKLLAWDYLSDFAKSAQVVNLFKDNGFYKKTTNLTGNQWNKVINYLRSVGIDCDGLIDKGFAIDKTKIAK